MTILPLAYLPSVEYFAHLRRGGCVVDLGEHFVKRSERNRARILATDGVMELTAHVARANTPCQPMREMRLDYSKRWQHQHWGALVASYKGSPFFDFYAEYFVPFYLREYKFLADYNLQLLDALCRAAQLPLPVFSESYVIPAADDLDLRAKHHADNARAAALLCAPPAASNPSANQTRPICSTDQTISTKAIPAVSILPAAAVHKKDPAFDAEPYVQVFSDRMPFEPNLSFVDLLFAEGPESVSVLKRCLRG